MNLRYNNILLSATQLYFRSFSIGNGTKRIEEIWEIPFLEWRKKRKRNNWFTDSKRNSCETRPRQSRYSSFCFSTAARSVAGGNEVSNGDFYAASVFPVGRHDPRARIGDEGFSICRWRSGRDKDRNSALASAREPIRNRLFVAGWISVRR